MNRTKTNILANFAGRFITATLAIVFVPVYLSYLTVEMYGIIGFFSGIQAFLLLLDGGISPTLTRETARLSASPETAQELNDVSRTLETLSWLTGGAACLIAIAASPLAASYWLTSNQIPVNTLTQVLITMSIALLFQWTSGFYSGGMQGLRRQGLLNIITIFIAVFRIVGAFLVLEFYSPTITAFLAWQLIASVVNCSLLAIFFWRVIPVARAKPAFRYSLFRGVWRYAAGMAGTSVVVLVLTQTDKLILSKLLSLEQFGYYTLATNLAASGIGLIVGSVQTAYFPEFSQLVSKGRIDEMRVLYHRACQVMTFFVVPIVGVLSFFSYEILLIWTGKPEIATNAHILLTLIAIGTGINGLVHLPYYAQLAFGVTKIGFWQNVIAIILLIPFMIFATINYGAVGGALSWLLINLSYAVFGMQIMHRFILKGELRDWYLRDTLPPVILTVGLVAVGYVLLDLSRSSHAMIVLVVAIFFLILTFITAISLPAIRTGVLLRLRARLADK